MKLILRIILRVILWVIVRVIARKVHSPSATSFVFSNILDHIRLRSRQFENVF